MKKTQRFMFITLGMTAALQCMAADIHFSSASDFTEIDLNLKRADGIDLRNVTLKVALAPDAQRRLARVTREEMNKPLRLYINGVLVSTATIKGVIESPEVVIGVPREVASSLIPTLLEPSAP
ncbi:MULTISPECIES: hypothetical protein [Pseudomonas]|uniref:Uncharacterized protein n=2 Tax=Pseudomonas TaxID=286 RepID=A0A165ZBZ7_PSEFL|nr:MULTISPECIES: hypothetical protein [Pseudomonas]AMZ72293.1 hypothetical protein TK06_14695 [Pseudomonas fluorescens]